MWTRQLTVDARANNLGGVTGDLATMEWTRDRFVDSIASTDRTREVAELRADILNGQDVLGTSGALPGESVPALK